MKKTYGIDKTQLRLTKLAQQAYNRIDPILIIENQDTDGNVKGYDLTGCLQGTGMTEEEVNEALEAELVFKIKPEHLEAFGPDADEDTELDIYEIRDLARCWDMPVEDVIPMLTIEGF